jgi:signal transduction histidine kinase
LLTFGGLATGVALDGLAATSSIKPAAVVLTIAFLSLPAVGALLVWRRPTNAVGWLLAATGVSAGIYSIAHGWAAYALRARPGELPGGEVAAWLVTWGLVPTFGVLPYLAASFPSGTIERPGLRRLGRVAMVALVGLAVAQGFAPDTLDGFDPALRPIANPLGVASLGGALAALTAVCVAVTLAFTMAAIADAIVRYRRSQGDERRQLRAVAFFPGLIPATIALSFVVPDRAVDAVIVTGQAAALVGLSVATAVAVLRYRLYDLGDYIRRIAAYVVLSGGAVIALLAVASLSGMLLRGRGVAPSAIAAAAVALALGPLRARLQQGVDRVLFGDRRDPYAVLVEVSAGLEASLNPNAALNDIVDRLALSLRLPYVAIDAYGPDGFEGSPAAIRHGELSGPTAAFALVHQHERVGTLVVGQRSADEAFTSAELELLGNLCPHVAVAVRASTTTAALQRARLDLVRGREEERRRLRRDIHDGLGPTLAGTMLQLDTLRQLIDGQAPAAEDLASRIKSNLRAMVIDVRRVSLDLRPPALDDLGMSGALRAQADSLTSGADLTVELDLPATIRPLPAAAEVAVYRIVSESLANIVRHAQASRCSIRLVVGAAIDLEIVDDGVGLPDGPTAGVGLVSMRERAAELGGTFTIERGEPAGTRVRVRLPLTS